jgi:CBS domain-containing protein
MEELIESVMIARVVTVKAKELLNAALKKMVSRNIGSVVVVAGAKPVGIVTQRDILRNVAKGSKTLRRSVARAMSRPVVAVSPNTSPQEAMKTMLAHRIRRLPVVKEGRLVGIVTERDLLRWVIRVSYEPNIPPEIKEILARPTTAKL